MPKTISSPSSRLVPLNQGGVLAPAAALMTIFLKPKPRSLGDPRTFRSFPSGLFRQLLQALAATMLRGVRDSIGADARDGDDDARLAKDYSVPTQSLADLLGGWVADGLLELYERKASATVKKRGLREYELTAKGAARMMQAVIECEDGICRHDADKLLLSLFTVRNFSLEQIRSRLPAVDSELERLENATSLDLRGIWGDWRVLNKRYIDVLDRHIAEFHQISEVMHAAVSRAKDSGISVQLVRNLTFARDGSLLLNGHPVPLDDDLNLYFPGLFPFNKRRGRSVQDAGLEVLMGFYEIFDDEFVQWHLGRGFDSITRHAYTPYIEHLTHMRETLKKLAAREVRSAKKVSITARKKAAKSGPRK